MKKPVQRYQKWINNYEKVFGPSDFIVLYLHSFCTEQYTF